jgi:transcriptional regulator with XRE-family HTH domain
VRTNVQGGGLRELRAARGLSLDAVAVLADVDPATVSRLERGLVEARRTTIVKLARALGISARRMAQILREAPEDGRIT